MDSSDSGSLDRWALSAWPGSAILEEQVGAPPLTRYDSDDAAHNYFALVNSDAVDQRVRYFAVLKDGTEGLVHDGLPAGFTFAGRDVQIGRTRSHLPVLRFEDGADGDYNDFVTRVSFPSLPSSPASTADESAALESLGAKISVVGMGSNADMTALNAIDNTLGADIVTSGDGLDVSLAGLPFKSAEIDHIVLIINSKALTYGDEDLVLGETLTLKVGATRSRPARRRNERRLDRSDPQFGRRADYETCNRGRSATID